MRTSNLIQSYISTHPVSQQYNSDKAVKEFDVHKELSNRTFIKPLPSNGKLVRKSLMDYPSELRKDILYDVNAFSHAVKGKANDHELGRLNDLGMKIGGIAIAGYLFSRKQTPMTKLFEFIGLGTFFAAMDLWPKLFIQLPAKLIHGVNVRQEYEDSFGRKKMFYQDHQFIPWDLYSEKEISKIGDRLGVDKDIPNRRDFIQEKMRKIALQNNTLWMLTAGFATPLMSALMCNMLEKPLATYLDQHTSKEADNLMANFSQEITKFDFSSSTKALDDILKSNAGKHVTEEFVESVYLNLSEGLDHVLADSLKADLDRLMPYGKYSLNESNAKSVQDVVKNILKSAAVTEDELSRIVPSVEQISNALKDRNLLVGSYTDFTEHSKIVQSLLDGNVQRFIEQNPSHSANKTLMFLMKRLVHSNNQGASSPLVQAFKTTNDVVLNDSLLNTLRTLSESLNSFKSKTFVLDKYAYMKAAQAPETGLANGWNEVQSTLFKALNYSPEEVAKARLDGEFASAVLRNKLEAVTSNKQSYANFVSEVEKALSSLQKRVQSLDMTQRSSSNTYKNHVNNTYDALERELRNLGFNSTIDTLVGFDKVGETSAKKLALDFISDRVLGVKSSFYRFLNLADMYYKISDQGYINSVLSGYPREVREELVELAKISLLEGHNSDFAVKFWQKRNPQPDRMDYSDIEVNAGKVINKYFGKHEPTDVVELANDRHFYDALMKLMFGGDVHPDTLAKIETSGFKSDFLKYRSDALRIFGGDKYFVKPNFLVDGKGVDTSSWYKFLLMGSSPNEMLHKWANNSFNSGKWFKVFGKLGAGLIGVTLLAQFFFGRMKKPEKLQEVKA